MRRWQLGLFIMLMSSVSWAYDPSEVTVTGHELPKELESVNVVDKTGQSVNLGLQFTDENGVKAPLGRFFGNSRPVLLAMVYYNCPSLCNFHLNGLTEVMKELKWSSGQEFEVVAVSMDHKETPDLAKAKLANYLKVYGRPGAEAGWHFLVGDKDQVDQLADQIGFQFKWLEDKQQFAHASVTYVMTPGGKISRYINGIRPELSTLKLSLLEASNGKIGTIIEQALMFCFQFDPKRNKYTLYSWNVMRLGGLFMLFVLAILLVPLWWREGRR